LYERLGYVAYGRRPAAWEEEGPDGSVTRYETVCTLLRKQLQGGARRMRQTCTVTRSIGRLACRARVSGNARSPLLAPAEAASKWLAPA